MECKHGHGKTEQPCEICALEKTIEHLRERLRIAEDVVIAACNLRVLTPDNIAQGAEYYCMSITSYEPLKKALGVWDAD